MITINFEGPVNFILKHSVYVYILCFNESSFLGWECDQSWGKLPLRVSNEISIESLLMLYFTSIPATPISFSCLKKSSKNWYKQIVQIW